MEASSILLEAKKLLESGELDVNELRDLLELLDTIEEVESVAGHRNWFVPGTEYGIEKLPKHKAVMDALNEYREVLVLGGNRCLLEGTLVATPTGPVAIEKLQVGDAVYDRYGKPTRVVATWDNGEADVISLSNRGKIYLTCTPNHKLDCIRQARADGGYNYPEIEEKKEASEMVSRNLVRRVQIKAPLGLINEPHAYAIGAMLGDGCGTCGTNTTMTISSINHKIPAKVAEILGCEYIKTKSNNYSWQILDLCNQYEEWIEYKYSYNKLAPLDVIKTWNRESLLNFVAGLIDTDGSLVAHKDGHTFALHSQNESILEAFDYAVLALWGERASRYIDNRDKYVHGKCMSSIIRNPYKIREAVTELAPYLVHKYKACIDETAFGGKRSRPDAMALKATPAGRGHVYDITVEHPEHCFLLANGLSVSNSGKTLLGCFCNSIMLTGDYPTHYHGVRFDGPVQTWAVGKTAQTTRDTLQRTLLGPVGAFGTGMIPRECIGKHTMSPVAGAVDSIKIKHLPTGEWSELGFKAYKQDTPSFYGTRKHFIHLDEPCPELIYNECVIRTVFPKGEKQGVVMHTITPKEGLTRLIADLLSTSDMLAGSEGLPNLSLAMALMKAEKEDNADGSTGG